MHLHLHPSSPLLHRHPLARIDVEHVAARTGATLLAAYGIAAMVWGFSDAGAPDLLVSLEVACRDRPDVHLVRFERESALRQRLALLPPGERRVPMPDGVFTLAYPGGAELTFYVEVVRALAKGGNRSILEKLEHMTRPRR